MNNLLHFFSNLASIASNLISYNSPQMKHKVEGVDFYDFNWFDDALLCSGFPNIHYSFIDFGIDIVMYSDIAQYIKGPLIKKQIKTWQPPQQNLTGSSAGIITI